MLLTPLRHRAVPTAVVVLLALALAGCAAWRDVTTVPQYRLVRRPKLGTEQRKALYRLTDERVSIFGLVDALPFIEDKSATVRSKQKNVGEHLLRVPAGILEFVYVVVMSPFFAVSYMLALPVWYDTDRDATFDMEPVYWEEYPWYWVTRGLWVIDFLAHDMPYVAIHWPVRVVRGKDRAWAEEWELDPFD